MTDAEYEARLERGRRELDKRLRDARERARLTMGCVATEKCRSNHHLACCPKRRPDDGLR